jgi:hypothetical protein
MRSFGGQTGEKKKGSASVQKRVEREKALVSFFPVCNKNPRREGKGDRKVGKKRREEVADGFIGECESCNYREEESQEGSET